VDGDGRGGQRGYLRRTLYHLAADGWRRKGMLRVRLGLLAQADVQADETASVDQRDQLVRLLHELPPRQRTAIVLRYWEERTIPPANARESQGRHVQGQQRNASQLLQQDLVAHGRERPLPAPQCRPDPDIVHRRARALARAGRRGFPPAHGGRRRAADLQGADGRPGPAVLEVPDAAPAQLDWTATAC
jgi:hypothetical protein